MKNPFKVGHEAPPELDEMFSDFALWDIPEYMDNLDWLNYASRGHLIEDQETADRLFGQYKQFLAEFKPEKFKELFECT